MLFHSDDKQADPGWQLDPSLSNAIDRTPIVKLAVMIKEDKVSLGEVLQLDSPKELLTQSMECLVDAGFAYLENMLWVPKWMPAATLGTVSVGSPHIHLPAVPTLIPALGVIGFSFSTDVLIHGLPAARVGDMGFVLCPTSAPVFKVITGSSKVFINGKRAARAFDATLHGLVDPSAKKPWIPTVVFNFARKTLGKYLVAWDERSDVTSKDFFAGTHAHTAEARLKAGAASGSPSLDDEYEAANAVALAEGAAAAAAGNASKMANLALQTAFDVANAAFDCLIRAQPATPPSIGVLMPSTNLTVSFAGLPVPSATVRAEAGKFAKGKLSRVGKIPPRIRDGHAATKLKLRAADTPKKTWKARVRELVPRPLRMLAGHPVDVVTGAVLTDAIDTHLRGRWTLPLRRTYSSAWAERQGPLGFGWSHSLDLAIWLEPGLLVHRAPDGRELFFDLPPSLDPTNPEALARLVLTDARNGLRITGETGGRWRITISDGDTYSSDGIQVIDFAPIAGERPSAGRHSIARAIRLRGPQGAQIDLSYDHEARLVALHQGPRSIGLCWHPQPGTAEPGTQDRLVAISLPDPQGSGKRVQVSYEFDSAGDLRGITDALGHRQELTYNAHRLTREVFADGRAFCFDYDGPTAAAKCLSTSGDSGVFARTFTYDPRSRLTTIVDGDGAQTNVQADGRGRVSTITDALGGTWSFEYNEHDRRICERDPLGTETHYSYDSLGRRRSVSFADRATWSFDHQLDGRLIAATNSTGECWRWRYDDLGRIIEAIDPLGAVSRCEMDPSSRTARIFAPARQAPQAAAEPSETLIFNDAGDLLQRRCADGSRWTYEYDRRGCCVAITDALGAQQCFSYDRMDRLIRRTNTTQSGSQHVLIQRDPAGRALRVEGPGSDITAAYGPTGSITSLSSIRALGQKPHQESERHYSYDLDGRLLTVREGEQQHSFKRDALGAIIRETTADGRTLHYRRDACTRIRERQDAGEQRTLYNYDLRGRIIAIDYADGGQERFDYSPSGALIRALRDEPVTGEAITSKPATSPRPSTEPPLQYPEPHPRTEMLRLAPAAHEGRMRHLVEFRRDPWSRVLGELVRDRHHPSKARWFAVERDRLGRPHLLRSDAGITLTSTYKNPRDLAPSQVELHTRRQRWVVDINHDLCGLESSRQLPGGLSSIVQRNTRGLPIRQTIRGHGGPFRDTFGAGGTTTLADRSYHWVDGTLQSIRDGSVNDTSSAHPSVPPTSNISTATAIEYDANGRVIRMCGSAGDMQLHWDAAGRLRCVEGSSQGPVRFDYDALGRRIRKTLGSRQTTWLWHGDRPIVEEIHDDDALISRCIWLFDPAQRDTFSPMAALVDGRFFGIICDHLGAPILAADTTGKIQWRRDKPNPSPEANPGQSLQHTSVPDALDLPFGLPGHYSDHETGLIYSRHRYFDPNRERFLSPDPSGLQGGLDPTAYVDDPATMIDPLGLRGYSVINGSDSGDDPNSNDCGAAHNGPLSPEPEAGARAPVLRTGPDPTDPTNPASPLRMGRGLSLLPSITAIYREQKWIAMTC